MTSTPMDAAKLRHALQLTAMALQELIDISKRRHWPINCIVDGIEYDLTVSDVLDLAAAALEPQSEVAA